MFVGFSNKVPSISEYDECIRCALFLKVALIISTGDRLTSSKFELDIVVSSNVVPSIDALDTAVKSTPERLAFLKLPRSRITSDRLTPDKFECANDVKNKSAPAKLLFFSVVRSTSTRSVLARFAFSKSVSTNFAR